MIDTTSHVHDDTYDGFLLGRDRMLLAPERYHEVLPMLPSNGAPLVDHVYYINGIMTPVERNFSDMQGLADTGCSVIGIHVSTAGLTTDLSRCIADKMHRGRSRAQTVLKTIIEKHCQAAASLHLVAHSRGALILSEALQAVSKNLDAQQRTMHFSRLKIETYGGASTMFPDGPRYVHVHNTLDPVSFFFGLGPAAAQWYPPTSSGLDARIRDVTHLNWPSKDLISRESLRESLARVVDHSVHGPREIYFQYREAFSTMYYERKSSMEKSGG